MDVVVGFRITMCEFLVDLSPACAHHPEIVRLADTELGKGNRVELAPDRRGAPHSKVALASPDPNRHLAQTTNGGMRSASFTRDGVMVLGGNGTRSQRSLP